MEKGSESTSGFGCCCGCGCCAWLLFFFWETVRVKSGECILFLASSVSRFFCYVQFVKKRMVFFDVQRVQQGTVNNITNKRRWHLTRPSVNSISILHDDLFDPQAAKKAKESFEAAGDKSGVALLGYLNTCWLDGFFLFQIADLGNLRKMYISLIDYCNGSVEIIENILRPGKFSSHVDAVNLLRRPWHFCDVMLLHQGEALALITTAKAQQGQETFRKKVMAIVGATS